MVKINVYDSEGSVMDSVDLSEQPPLFDPGCPHPPQHVIVVPDNSGIEGVTAYQRKICTVGWLVKDKIKEE